MGMFLFGLFFMIIFAIQLYNIKNASTKFQTVVVTSGAILDLLLSVLFFYCWFHGWH